MELRQKIIAELAGHMTRLAAQRTADAILAIPEIRDALEAMNEPDLPPLTNEQMRAALDKLMTKPNP